MDIGSRVRAHWQTLLNLAVSVVLLGVLLAVIDWPGLLAAVRSVSLPLFLASYGVFLVGGVVLAFRLHVLLAPTPLRQSTLRLFIVWLRTTFYGLLVPGEFGAVVARWYLVTGNRQGRRLFIFVTGLERLMLVTGSLALTAIPLVFADDPWLAEFRAVALPVLLVLLALCLAAWSVFVTPVYQWFSALCGWWRARCRWAWLAEALSFSDDIQVYRSNPWTLIKALAVQALFQLTLFARVWLLFLAVRAEVSPAAALWMSMLVILITTIPISFAGVGVREISFAWLVALYGLPGETGVLVGAMITVQSVLTALLGGIASLRSAAPTTGLTQEPPLNSTSPRS